MSRKRMNIAGSRDCLISLACDVRGPNRQMTSSTRTDRLGIKVSRPSTASRDISKEVKILRV